MRRTQWTLAPVLLAVGCSAPPDGPVAQVFAVPDGTVTVAGAPPGRADAAGTVLFADPAGRPVGRIVAGQLIEGGAAVGTMRQMLADTGARPLLRLAETLGRLPDDE